MSDLTRITSENNLGISGDAQNAEELAGRGLHLVFDSLEVIDEALATITRLRNPVRLAQNDGQDRELDVTGTNMRTSEKTAQTGAGEAE